MSSTLGCYSRFDPRAYELNVGMKSLSNNCNLQCIVCYRAAFEHGELARVRWSGAIIALYLLFAACMFLFYSLVAVVMQKASALMFNLSVLTADFYTLLFGLFLFKYEVRLVPAIITYNYFFL